MNPEERVFIAGAGPVGLVAAAALVRQGIPVTVFEAADTLGTESRASTFHPPTLDMLDDLGFAADLMAQGLKAPKLQYRTKRDGILGEFDFGAIADVTRHPFRVQAEQSKLTRIILSHLQAHELFDIQFGARVTGVTQDTASVTVRLAGPDGGIPGGGIKERQGRWLIGTDGARSEVRASLGIGFEGFTWPERFLVLTTPFDFDAVVPGLADVSYVADPDRWHFLLRIPGAWRVMFPVPAQDDDATALTPAYAQAALATAIPAAKNCEVQHTTLYRVHQRVAETFRKGRAFLAGDAAHINNPLGGMGMNGGIHDVVDLAGRLGAVWRGTAPESELDQYDRQRRLVTMESVQTGSIQNKRNLEARDETDRTRFRDEMRRTAADPALTRALLLRVSMITSLRRAEELGAAGGDTPEPPA
jgi:3-(3-hydroxy-phenyl)propionate hydroxylase